MLNKNIFCDWIVKRNGSFLCEMGCTGSTAWSFLSSASEDNAIERRVVLILFHNMQSFYLITFNSEECNSGKISFILLWRWRFRSSDLEVVQETLCANSLFNCNQKHESNKSVCVGACDWRSRSFPLVWTSYCFCPYIEQIPLSFITVVNPPC